MANIIQSTDLQLQIKSKVSLVDRVNGPLHEPWVRVIGQYVDLVRAKTTPFINDYKIPFSDFFFRFLFFSFFFLFRERSFAFSLYSNDCSLYAPPCAVEPPEEFPTKFDLFKKLLAFCFLILGLFSTNLKPHLQIQDLIFLTFGFLFWFLTMRF